MNFGRKIARLFLFGLVCAVLSDAATAEQPEVGEKGQELQQEELLLPQTDASGVATLEGDEPGRNAGDPCRIANTIKDAWIDRLQMRLRQTVCGSAVWFDHFFGQGETVDSEEFYGAVGIGFLYKTAGDWEDASRFDVNFPLPNLSKRTNAFVGRQNEDDFITDRKSSVAEPIARFEQDAEKSWLAGLGYSPPGERGKRFNYRVGVRLSSEPYVFLQARYRFNYFPSDNRAFRFRETLFYRTDDDGLGATSAAGYDWFLKKEIMARLSGSATVSQDTDGATWNAFVTIYHDLSTRWGRARGVAYQYFIRGETSGDVTVPERGLRATFRQQLWRPYLFGETTLGYSWDHKSVEEETKGSVNLGFMIEINFGERWKKQSDRDLEKR